MNLDPSYQLLKNTIKEILDQNQTIGQSTFIRLNLPIQLICNMIRKYFSKASNSNQTSQISSFNSSINSSLGATNNSNNVFNKTMIDILILLWESYFCKHLNSSFTISNSSNSLLSNLNEFNQLIQNINKICSHEDPYNLFYLFLKFLFLNLEETTSASNSTNLVWRQFKGRLYTRLHDKRIAELDLTGIINISHLFFILIKSFSKSTSITVTQLKFEQVENYFRILNVFINSKNMQKLDTILSLSNTSSLSTSLINAKTNAIKTFTNMKFVALRLWYNPRDFQNETSVNSNSEEIDALIKQEFFDNFNNWLNEAHSIYNSDSKENLPQNSNSNQISGFELEKN